MKFVQRMAGAAAVGAALLIGGGLFAAPAQAGYIVTLLQEGPNVVATGSGAIDLIGLTPSADNAIETSGIVPIAGVVVTGQSPALNFVYTGFNGPTSFGNGNGKPASSGSGDSVGILGEANFLLVPAGYVPDTPLSDTSTYDNETFATLGVIPGVYEWIWGTGANQNFTLQIGPVAVPEPSSLALVALPLGLVMLLAARHRRDRAYNKIRLDAGRAISPV